ncbi:hypothetical protein AMELA_G00094700, partial [Ameiurus melas]
RGRPLRLSFDLSSLTRTRFKCDGVLNLIRRLRIVPLSGAKEAEQHGQTWTWTDWSSVLDRVECLFNGLQISMTWSVFELSRAPNTRLTNRSIYLFIYLFIYLLLHYITFIYLFFIIVQLLL